MNNTQILIVMLSLTITTILAIWALVGIRHFKMLQHSILQKWKILDIRIKMRHNLIPNLVETIRKYLPMEEYTDILNSRDKAMREYFPNSLKFEFENDLTSEIDRILLFGDEYQAIKFNTNFLELRKELIDLYKELEEISNQYNIHVRKYNQDLRLIILRPIAFIFNFKPVNIFDI